MRIAHLAFDLGLRNQRRDRVDDDQVDRARAHQRLGNLQGLLAGVRLRDEQVLDADAELPGVGDVERVLRVDERCDSAQCLHLCDGVQRQSRLARGLRPIDLDDPAARIAAAAERDVEADRTARNHIDFLRLRPFAQTHHRSLSELLLDRTDGGRDGLQLLRQLAHVPSLGCSPG